MWWSVYALQGCIYLLLRSFLNRMWFPTNIKLKELRTPSQILEFTLLPEGRSLGVEGQGCVWPAQHCSFDLTSTLHLSCKVTSPRDRNCWLRWRHQSRRVCCPKVRVEQHGYVDRECLILHGKDSAVSFSPLAGLVPITALLTFTVASADRKDMCMQVCFFSCSL